MSFRKEISKIPFYCQVITVGRKMADIEDSVAGFADS